MFDLLRARWRQGTRTIAFPPGEAALPERFRGRPALDPERMGPARSIPSAVLTATADGQPALDTGACLFAPEEAGETPVGRIAFSRDYRLASSTREGLVSASGEVELAHALGELTRHLFGRSLRLRSVAAGSCGGCARPTPGQARLHPSG